MSAATAATAIPETTAETAATTPATDNKEKQQPRPQQQKTKVILLHGVIKEVPKTLLEEVL